MTKDQFQTFVTKLFELGQEFARELGEEAAAFDEIQNIDDHGVTVGTYEYRCGDRDFIGIEIPWDIFEAEQDGRDWRPAAQAIRAERERVEAARKAEYQRSQAVLEENRERAKLAELKAKYEGGGSPT